MDLEVLFIKGESLLDRQIQRVTHSRYSHVALRLDTFMIADTGLGQNYQVRPLPWPIHMYDTVKIAISRQQHKDLMTYVLGNIGRKYDKIEALRWIAGPWIRDDINRLNCVEAIYDALEHVGFFLPGDNTRSLSPGELYRLLTLTYGH